MAYSGILVACTMSSIAILCSLYCVFAVLVNVTANEEKFVEGEYIIRLKRSKVPDKADEARVVGLMQSQFAMNMTKEFRLPSMTFLHAKLSKEAAEGMAKLPEVEYIEKNIIVHADQSCFSCNVVSATNTWGLNRIDGRAKLPNDPSYPYLEYYMYDRNTGKGVTAYIIDSGIQIDHPDFGGRATWGHTAQGLNGGNIDENGHGTHVAGTIGSNSYGVARGVDLVAVKVYSDGGFPMSNVLDAVEWTIGHHNGRLHAKSVVNLSISSEGYQPADDAVTALIDSGIIVVVAAGNQGGDACLRTPARVPEAITVSGTNNVDERRSSFNYGDCVDIFAPGKDILSTIPGSSTGYKTGTSMASPHVAGVAARYLSSLDAIPTQQEVSDWLKDQATKDVLSYIGNGSPNLLLYTACPM